MSLVAYLEQEAQVTIDLFYLGPSEFTTLDRLCAAALKTRDTSGADGAELTVDAETSGEVG